MRKLLLAGLTFALSTSPLAAQADSMKKAPPQACCAGMGASGGMPHHAGMMGGMDHMKMRQGGMGGMGEMMGPMARVQAFDPEHLLAAKDKLELTEQQVTRLTALRDAGTKAADAAHEPAHAAMQALMKEMQAASPDTARVRQYFMAHEAGMANVQWARASTALKARAVLNDAQRGRVAGWMDAMMDGQMMQHHEMPGMQHPIKP